MQKWKSSVLVFIAVIIIILSFLFVAGIVTMLIISNSDSDDTKFVSINEVPDEVLARFIYPTYFPESVKEKRSDGYEAWRVDDPNFRSWVRFKTENTYEFASRDVYIRDGIFSLPSDSNLDVTLVELSCYEPVHKPRVPFYMNESEFDSYERDKVSGNYQMVQIGGYDVLMRSSFAEASPSETSLATSAISVKFLHNDILYDISISANARPEHSEEAVREFTLDELTKVIESMKPPVKP